MKLVSLALVLVAIPTFGCESSSPDPIDPLAIEYCAECSEDPSCERVVNDAITTVCSEENSAYYRCLVDNSCDFSSCSAEWDARNICLGTDAANRVRVSIELAQPVANLGQRGTGPTRPESPFPENSISSFFGALDEGANGVELDVQLTADGNLIVMHDPTVDRTTTGTGCVSALTFDEIRATRLLDANGAATDERPPTLAESFTAAGGVALVNLDLRVFESTAECPVGTDREALYSAGRFLRQP